MSTDPTRCPLFVELCAGTAALSLRLHHPRARPPVSRMGAKTGYADVILRCMGLRPGQGSADGTRYLWCEPDKGVRLLLHAYRDRALALAAAEVIRGWADEEPRALWERLRAEGPAVCPPVDAREVARFLYGSAASYGGPKGALWDSFLHPEEGGRYGAARADVADKTAALPTVEATIADDARAVDAREVARFLLSEGWTMGNGGRCVAPGACPDGVNPAVSADGLIDRLQNGPKMPATITADARDIDPREVARAARLLTANRLINLDPETWRNTGEGGTTHGGAEFCTPAPALADAVEGVPEVPGAVVDDARAVDPREVARWSWMSQRSIFNGFEHGASFVGPNPVRGGHTRYAPTSPARAVEAAPTLPATITDDARKVDPREVARWSLIQANEWRGNAVIERDGELWAMAGEVGRTILRRVQMVDARDLSLENLSKQFRATPDPPATLADDARAVDPPQLPPGVVAYIDPPYLNTTGYAHAFPRSEWLPIVRRWAEAGALVVVSEAEPIPELVAEGWHAVEITGERKGQKRTFSKQQREWLTMSRPPAWKPSEQMGLFNGG